MKYFVLIFALVLMAGCASAQPRTEFYHEQNYRQVTGQSQVNSQPVQYSQEDIADCRRMCRETNYDRDSCQVCVDMKQSNFDAKYGKSKKVTVKSVEKSINTPINTVGNIVYGGVNTLGKVNSIKNNAYRINGLIDRISKDHYGY